jgi:uncharacterized membrane protein YhaH (DUF805 family)
MNCHLDALQKYAQFCGRAQRQEFWTFTLVEPLELHCCSLASVQWRMLIEKFEDCRG